MEYFRDLSARYRVPDLTRLWRGGDDDADGAGRRQEERSLLLQLESSLVRFQELALWTGIEK